MGIGGFQIKGHVRCSVGASAITNSMVHFPVLIIAVVSDTSKKYLKMILVIIASWARRPASGEVACADFRAGSV